MKRIFDIIFAFFGIVFFSPILLLVSLMIALDSKGGILYKQIRVGKNNKDFEILKFRTMRPGSDKKGLLTVGGKDNRVTKIGYFLRKFKLDELPQLFNVIKGDMSFVGPRPEVRKYVTLYNQEQLEVLTVKPGITDLASIEFRNENELLAQQEDPDQYYIQRIMPEKIKINLRYIHNRKTILSDVVVILKTIKAIFA